MIKGQIMSFITNRLAEYNIKYHNAKNEEEGNLIFSFKLVLEEIQSRIRELEN